MTLPAGTNADYYTLIDGGVFANNPAACALVEAKTTHPEAGGFLVVSLGNRRYEPELVLSRENENLGCGQMGAPGC